MTSLANLGRDFWGVGFLVWGFFVVAVALFSDFGFFLFLLLNGWLINYLVSS